ncbi:hypothetical protein Aglo03_43780 [Actinokineospora globicatena]|uniref:Uncharacterized protein n=1 Tax=Actinokineospora globicatena TaxID=103729 RepID=A0A9W6QS13_9PSEU|nr:hypothetical protein Aglo03_43780 [Actinokineospora globicatena]
MVVGLLIHTVVWLTQEAGTVDWKQELLKFLMPIWLTVGALPYLYVFALACRYEILFNMYKAAGRPPARARIGTVLALRGNLDEIRQRWIATCQMGWYRNQGATTGQISWTGWATP